MVTPRFRKSVPIVVLLLGYAVGVPLAAKTVIQGTTAGVRGFSIAQAPPSTYNQAPAEVRQWAQQAYSLDSQGSWVEALALQQKVVGWVRANPKVGEADTAITLEFLGKLYSQLGRHSEALPPTQEAVAIFRKLAATNPAFQGDLARAQYNLGNRYNDLGIIYSDLGHPSEALPPALEAVAIFRKLTATNPAIRDDLARALTNLGGHYSKLGRPSNALPPTLEAVAIIRRKQVASDPTLQDYLGRPLVNLAKIYIRLGRPSEALPPALEAVAIFRKLAATNPALQGDLAVALLNLGATYGALGRPSEALPPTLESVAILRKLEASNPALQGDLAQALANLKLFNSMLGRRP